LFLDKKKYFPLLTEVKICPGFSEAVPEMSWTKFVPDFVSIFILFFYFNSFFLMTLFRTETFLKRCRDFRGEDIAAVLRMEQQTV
jgi:hypothetical protein